MTDILAGICEHLRESGMEADPAAPPSNKLTFELPVRTIAFVTITHDRFNLQVRALWGFGEKVRQFYLGDPKLCESVEEFLRSLNP